MIHRKLYSNAQPLKLDESEFGQTSETPNGPGQII